MISVIMKNGYWHVILLRVIIEILQILLYNSYILICHQLPHTHKKVIYNFLKKIILHLYLLSSQFLKIT